LVRMSTSHAKSPTTHRLMHSRYPACSRRIHRALAL